MTGPRSTPEQRAAELRIADQRIAEQRAAEQRAIGRRATGDLRSAGFRGGDLSAGGMERSRATPSPKVPWLELHAVRIRWTTWIAIALIVIRLVAPRPDGWRRWHDASAALLDVEAARTAALLSYQASSRQWPTPGKPGVAPSALVPFLPGGVSFSRPGYRLAWEYAADTVSGARVIGISVIGEDANLALTMAERAPAGMPFMVSGRRFTALVSSSAGR